MEKLPSKLRALWRLVVCSCLLSAFASADEDPVFEYTSKVDGKILSCAVRGPNRVGKWDPSTPLPIAEKDIAKAGKEEIDRHVADPSQWHYRAFDIIRYRGGDNSTWYFVTYFGRRFTRRSGNVEGSMVRVIVLFDGKAVPFYERQDKPRFVALEEQLWKRAAGIIIPQIEFKDATFTEALETIRNDDAKFDPKHVGVPIEAKLPSEPLPGTEAVAAPIPKGRRTPNPADACITVSLTDIPLPEALQYVAGFSGWHAVATPTCLTIVPGNIWEQGIQTYTFPLVRVSKSALSKMRADPKQYFMTRGVKFPEGTSCSFANDGVTLILKGYDEQMRFVQEVLQKLPRLSRKP